MSTCTEIVLTGKRCAEETTPTPVSNKADEYCYYHGKVHDGLTGPAEPIGVYEDDD